MLTHTSLRNGVLGGGLCGGCSVNHPNAEIFTPPYLLNDDGSLRSRPQILEAPTSTLAPGSQFSVQMNSSQAHSFALVRLSAATHSTNNDLRRIPLTVLSQSGSAFQLQLSSNKNVALPGTYWLFAMNVDGTPSLGYTVSVEVESIL